MGRPPVFVTSGLVEVVTYFGTESHHRGYTSKHSTADAAEALGIERWTLTRHVRTLCSGGPCPHGCPAIITEDPETHRAVVQCPVCLAEGTSCPPGWPRLDPGAQVQYADGKLLICVDPHAGGETSCTQHNPSYSTSTGGQAVPADHQRYVYFAKLYNPGPAITVSIFDPWAGC